MSTADGWSLDVDVRPAVGPSRGVVLCGHAMFCNRRTLDKPAGQGLGSVLAAHGLDVWLVDFRGHGESRPALGSEVDASYDDYILQDWPAVIRAARAEKPDRPVALLGHSLGAHAGLAAVACDRSLPVDALVSLAGNVWIPSLEPDRLRWLGKRATFEAWGAVSRAVGYFPARRLGVGTDDEALSYVMQFVRNAREDRWGSVDRRYDYLRLIGHVRLPVLSVAGSADTWMAHPACIRQWLKHAWRAEITERVVGARAGDPPDVDHMGLVTDQEMAPIWGEIARWIVEALSGGLTAPRTPPIRSRRSQSE